jgi:threonine dehydrogenase-like Zn-dependent dehydrogenase
VTWGTLRPLLGRAQAPLDARGGFAPARAYIPELLPDVLEGRIDPGRVLDYATDLEGIADAYAAMDERRAIKSLVHVGTV